MNGKRLDDLGLDDLLALNSTMAALAAAGQMMAQAGLRPTFDLSPGLPMTVTVDVAMPASRDHDVIDGLLARYCDENLISAAGQTGADLPSQGGAGVAEPGRDGDPLPPVAATFGAALDEVAAKGPVVGLQVAPDTTGDGGAVDHMIAVPVEQPAPVEDPVGSDITLPVAREGDAEPQARAAAAVTVADPPAVVAGSAAAGVKTMPDRWTVVEDAKALEIYGATLRSGGDRDAAYLAIGKALDRPYGGVGYRLRTKFSAEVACINMAVAREIKAAADVPVASKTVTTKVQAAAPAPDLAGHLASLPDTRGWQRTWDMDLMQLACDGFDMGAIASDLGTNGATVRVRFDALTGIYKDANDKPCRRFSREQVRDHLVQRASATAAE